VSTLRVSHFELALADIDRADGAKAEVVLRGGATITGKWDRNLSDDSILFLRQDHVHPSTWAVIDWDEIAAIIGVPPGREAARG
jgi:hypothetical protein